MIETKTRFPGAPLADPGMEALDRAVTNLRNSEALTPVPMGAQGTRGGVQGQGSTSDVVVGAGELQGVLPRPVEEETERLVNFLIPREDAEKALAIYDRHLMNGYDAVYALQRACLCIAESRGWHQHIRAGGER